MWWWRGAVEEARVVWSNWEMPLPRPFTARDPFSHPGKRATRRGLDKDKNGWGSYKRHWMMNILKNTCWVNVAKGETLKCVEVWCRGCQGLLFSWAFSQNSPLQLAMAVKLECQKRISLKMMFCGQQPFSTANYFISITIDIINEEWCIELNLNLKNAWM